MTEAVQTGIKASLSGFAFGALMLLLLRIYLVWENRRRDRVTGRRETQEEDHSDMKLSDLTDWHRPDFRYIY